MQGNDGFPIFAAPLDVAEIDRYLLKLVIPHAISFSQSIGIKCTNIAMTALLHAALLCATNVNTPGAVALGLRACNNSRKHVYLYTLLKSVLPAMYQSLVTWHNRSFVQGENENLSCFERRAFERKRRVFQKLIVFIGKLKPIIRAFTLIAWWNGSVSAPTASLLASGIYFTGVTNPKAINVSYAHRRWLYDLILCSFTLSSPVNEIGDLMAIMDNNFVSPLRNLYRHLFGKLKHKNQCAICNIEPVVVPWYCSCNHLYCYTCVWLEIEKRQNFVCKNCRNQIIEMNHCSNNQQLSG
jgi:hypothetical protein